MSISGESSQSDFSDIKHDIQPEANMQMVRPHLWIGNKHAERQHFNALQAANISHVLQLGETKRRYPQCIIYKTLRVQDGMKQDLLSYLPKIMEFIDAGRNAGGVLVLCTSGRSLAAAVVMAYLMAQEKLSFLEAFDQVEEVRRVCPNGNFVLQLLRWQRICCQPDNWAWKAPSVKVLKVGESDGKGKRGKVTQVSLRGGKTNDKQRVMDTFAVVHSPYVMWQGDVVYLRRGAFP